MVMCHKSSVEDRRQKGACGLIVEAYTHEGHWLDHPKPMFQTPPEQLRIARRHEEPGSSECRSRADESFQLFVCLAHGVPEERDRTRIAGDTASALDHHCGVLFDRI